ncbi:hypothetical protein [Spongiimicrobium sp. 3-5]|uniref:hypothetical protein n=1 Tax=Spongiimicrobium sp. 3-5 TaxID=3332596 RepID=UPI0039815DF8
MKNYVVLLVALTMLIRPLWPVAEYVMNYDYIVNVLCENKDKPQLQCDGKCYLAKQLAKASEHNEENPFGEKQSKTEVQHPVFFQSLLSIHFEASFLHDSQNNYNTTPLLISSLFSTDISEPPELG